MLLLLLAQARSTSIDECYHQEDNQPEKNTANPSMSGMISSEMLCTHCLAYLARDRSTKKDLRAITRQ